VAPLERREELPALGQAGRPLRILHVILAVRETSAPYNEHCLPWAGARDVSICSYFGPDVAPPAAIALYAGDGTLAGFLRALRTALAAKDYDVIHAHSPHVALLLLAATLASRRSASSAVVTVHDSYQNFKLRNRLMFLPVFASFRSVVCCGRASFESFPRVYKWLAGDRLGFVPNGLDIARVDRIAASARTQPRRPAAFTVVAISRLVDVKNPFGVLNAFKEAAAPGSRLTYIGDGPLRGALLKEAGGGGEGYSIEFTGLIPRERVFEHLLGSDLFVSMSRGEGLPVAPLEAMACGCPVLLSDIPPHREIAEGVPFVPLVRTDEVHGFAREIRRYAQMPAPERAAIGRSCRKLVEERFSLPAMHAGYAAVYRRVLGR
jgi:glycosyltransferase involved in cell wall biosynthesis